MKITAAKENVELLTKQMNYHKAWTNPNGNIHCTLCEDFWPCPTFTRTLQVIALSDLLD